MATKNPLCLYSGEIKELQSGDVVGGVVGGVSLSGIETLSNKTLTNYLETVGTPSSNAIIDINASDGNIQVITLTDYYCTLNLPFLAAGKSMTIALQGDCISTFITYSGQTLRWNDGIIPERTIANGDKYDIYIFLAISSTIVCGFNGGRNI